MNKDRVHAKLKKISKLADQINSELKELEDIVEKKPRKYKICGYYISKHKESTNLVPTNLNNLREDSFSDEIIYDNPNTNGDFLAN